MFRRQGAQRPHPALILREDMSLAQVGAGPAGVEYGVDRVLGDRVQRLPHIDPDRIHIILWRHLGEDIADRRAAEAYAAPPRDHDMAGEVGVVTLAAIPCLP